MYSTKQRTDTLYNTNLLYNIKSLPVISWSSLPSQSSDDNIYFKEWLDFMYDNNYFESSQEVVYIGCANPNYLCMFIGFMYGRSDAKKWSLFYYMKPDNNIKKFGYRNGVWFLTDA